MKHSIALALLVIGASLFSLQAIGKETKDFTPPPLKLRIKTKALLP